MNVLDGIQNFLYFVNNNWMSIIVIIGLLIAIVQKIIDYIGKSKEEKVDIAKQQIQETMLKLITDAECDYYEWSKAGEIKRAQVIEKLFSMYPVLSKVTNQDELISWIDNIIDESLKTMRDIFEENNQESEMVQTN